MKKMGSLTIMLRFVFYIYIYIKHTHIYMAVTMICSSFTVF
jgi:hypothetical protein